MEDETLAAELAAQALGAGPLYHLSSELDQLVLAFIGQKMDQKTLMVLQHALKVTVQNRFHTMEVETRHDAVNGYVEVETPYKGAKLQFRVFYRENRVERLVR